MNINRLADGAQRIAAFAANLLRPPSSYARAHKRGLAITIACCCALIAGWEALCLLYSPQLQLWSVPPGAYHMTASDDTQDKGRITISVDTSRQAGYRLGDPVNVQVVVSASAGATIDPTSFQLVEPEDAACTENSSFCSAGDRVSLQAQPDFELVQPPQVSSYWSQGKHIYVFHLVIRSWLTNSQLFFDSQVGFLDPAEKISKWQLLVSPEVAFSFTHTAAGKASPDMGSGAPQPTTVAPGAQLFHLLGQALLVVLMLALLSALTRHPHALLGDDMPEDERAWMIFDRVHQNAAGNWRQSHYESIATALRRCLHIESLTVEEAEASTNLPHRDVVIRALKWLEQPLYRKNQKPGRNDREALYADLAILVPRPDRDKRRK